MVPKKRNGISVLIACQDDHFTLRDCVESFLTFGDEVIVVSNQATEETRELAAQLACEHPAVVKYIDLPNTVHLYENRQVALSYASYRWVVRGDADYIAYGDEDGENSVANLRRTIMNLWPSWPTVVYVPLVSMSMGWYSMYEGTDENGRGDLQYIKKVYTGTLEPRIYLNTPMLRFTRLGRWEGVPNLRWYRKVRIHRPFWFEVTLRSHRSLFLRKARTDWREVGDFVTFPTVEDYVKWEVLPKDYPALTLEQAADQYVREEVMPWIVDYDEERYFPLPNRIRKKGGT